MRRYIAAIGGTTSHYPSTVSSNPKLVRHCALLHPRAQHAEALGAATFQLLQLAIKICAFPLARRKNGVSQPEPPGILEYNLTCVPQLLVQVHLLGSRVQRCPLITTP